MKVCKKCLSNKEPNEFYSVKPGQYRDNLTPWCKPCYRKDTAKRSVENPEPKKKRAAQRYQENIETIKKRQKLWRLNNRHIVKARNKRHPNRGKKEIQFLRSPLKRKAGAKLSYAIRSGAMPPAKDLKCTACEAPARHYHHYKGYGPCNFLEVVPLCIPCHVRADMPWLTNHR